MDPATIALLSNAVMTGAKHFLAPKRQAFNDTAYGQRLKELKEYGHFNPNVRAEMMGRISKSTANAAQGAKVEAKGRMQQAGTAGSLASESILANYDQERLAKLADLARSIELRNMQTKSMAADEYAKAKSEYDQTTEQIDAQRNMTLLSDAANLVGQGAQLFANKKMAKDFSLSDPEKFIQNSSDPAQAAKIFSNVAYGQSLMDRNKPGVDLTPISEMSDLDQALEWIASQNLSSDDMERAKKLIAIKFFTE